MTARSHGSHPSVRLSNTHASTDVTNTALASADAAGIVLGAKVPVILTSRADNEIARLASCAVAQLMVAARKSSASAAIQ